MRVNTRGWMGGGSGRRIGIDRDLDGNLNGDERDSRYVAQR